MTSAGRSIGHRSIALRSMASRQRSTRFGRRAPCDRSALRNTSSASACCASGRERTRGCPKRDLSYPSILPSFPRCSEENL
jgi:hypothetical protein